MSEQQGTPYSGAMALAPEDVFTPAAPVQEDMFAARRHEDLENRVLLALNERGKQVILYGDTGVGKTSLMNHMARVRRVEMIRVECGGTFEETLQQALAAAAERREVKRTRKTSGEVEASGTFFGILTGRAKAAGGTDVEYEPIEAPFYLQVVEALEASGVRILFLDNYENIFGHANERGITRSIVQLLKTLSDRAAEGKDRLKAVVAGIPSASEALIAFDDATARRIEQIEVPRMPDEELDQILERGEKKLRISFGGHARHMILAYSDGFPYYTHLLALHTSRRVIGDGRDEVSLADFDDALDAILQGCDLRLRNQYNRAVETTGDVRARKSILEAIASLNDREVPFKAIRTAFLRAHPRYGTDPTRLNFLSTAIKPFKEEYAILEDRNLPKSKRNAYRFKNPLMRAYVRLRMRKEGTGQAAVWDPSVGAPAELPEPAT